jgi:hypothetical protein
MRCHESERGSALIMVIGVIAALAILATSLSVLTVNVMHNTAQDRTRAKAFNVAEAGLDGALFAVGTHWPFAGDPAPALDKSTFTAVRYPVDEFPSMTVDAIFYDNSDTGGAAGPDKPDNKISKYDAKYDANNDGYMIVETLGQVGSKSAHIRALVQRSILNLELPRGVAFYSTGNLWLHGGGVAIGVEIPPPNTDHASVYVAGTITSDGRTTMSSSVSPPITGASVPPLGEIWPSALKSSLLSAASGQGRYFDDTIAAQASYATPVEMADAQCGVEGLIYIKSASQVKLVSNDVYNGDNGATIGANGLPAYPEKPGVLFVDAPELELNGTLKYYGAIFCTGKITFVGNPEVHGMMLCEGVSLTSTVGGSEALVYNDNVWMALNNVVTVGARVVPGTWQELGTATSL